MAVWQTVAFAGACVVAIAGVDYRQASLRAGVPFGELPIQTYLSDLTGGDDRFDPATDAQNLAWWQSGLVALMPGWSPSTQDARSTYVFDVKDVSSVSAAHAQRNVEHGVVPGSGAKRAEPLPLENGVRVRRGGALMPGAPCVRRALERLC